MSYLEIVNAVLRRLREEQVSSLYQNRLSALVAELVNDAKNEVENAHDWSALRTDIAVGTSDAVQDYILLGSGNRVTVKDVRDVTNQVMLRPASSYYMRKMSLVSDQGSTRPSYWALQGTDSSDDTIMRLWPVPDDNYVLKVHCVARTPDLTEEGSELTIPSQPVILLTYAMAAQDRGDVDSASLQSIYERARSSLANEVQLDAAKNADEMVWGPV